MKVRRAVTVVMAALLGCGGSLFAGERDLFDLRNRFLEGEWPAVTSAPSVLTVESFEDADRIKRDWQARGVVVEQSAGHATEGRHSLKATFADGRSQLAYLRASWNGFPFIRQLNFFDELRFDVFNPGGPMRLSVQMVNTFRFSLKTGHNEIRIDTREMKRGRLMHFNLNPDGIIRVEGGANAVLYFDNFRWIGPGLGKNLLASAKCFDFGPAAWCRPGFLAVEQGTGYAPGRGYGWERPHVPKHRYDQKQSTTYTYNPCSDLVGDMVRGMTSPLRVDLPAGRYRLHLVEGHVGYLDPMCSYWDLGVRIDGGPTTLLRRGARTFEEFARFEYGRERTDCSPQDDRWQSYMACRHRVLEHDFEVKGDHVMIEFVSDPPGMAQLAFLIVYPLDRAVAIEPEIAGLWREIRDRFNTHAFGFIPRAAAERLQVPGFHEEYLDANVGRRKLEELHPDRTEEDRGYVVFHREPTDAVYPDTVPARTECTAKVASLTPPGEIETLTVSVFALRDVEGVTLEVSDFSGPGGRTIPAKAVDVRAVNCTYEMAARESHGDWSFLPKPRWLVKRGAVDVPRNTCRRFWINVDVPGDTAPGTYVARGTIRTKNAGEAVVRLELDVLPFKLDPVPAQVEHSVNITYPYHPIIDRELLVFLRRHSQFLKEEKWKRLAREARDAHRRRIAAEFDFIRRYGFRRAFMEGNYVEKVPLTAEVTRGIDVVRYTQKASAQTLSEGVEFVGLRDFSEERVAQVLARGKVALLERGAASIMPLWYPDQESGASRFQAGFFLWRSGNRAHREWGWSRHLGDRYNPFCSEPGLYWGLWAPGSSDWPTLNPSVVLEGAREGIEDFRWLATLERLVGEHKGKPASREARAYLDDLRRRIGPRLDRYLRRVGSGGFGGGYWTFAETADAWTGKDYLRERRTMAALITKLVE
ncbi:MAG TPA: hypothetical protein VMZ92_11470 [Planctomycetota bacterium]|nr:hypothetical protein [Planctomycetota bacterium]